MASVIKDDIRFPVKIGSEARVPLYAATLINGEEQLLVTRTLKFFLTDGHGGVAPFPLNDGHGGVAPLPLDDVYTKTQVDNMFTINTRVLNQKIDVLSTAVVSPGNEFSKYVLKTDYEVFKLATQNSISTLDGAILDVIDDLSDTTTLATHDNMDVIDKFSEDADGNPLYNGNKLATSIQTIADASTIMINITENGTVIQKTLQEVIDMILAGGYIPVTPTDATVAECGLAECGTTECGA